jgi:Darcynin, domain of unknown function
MARWQDRGMRNPDEPVTYSFFMLVRTTDAWLALPPPQRFAFLRAQVEPRLRAHPAVTLRFFDAEAFSARVTDVLLWQTTSLGAYGALIEGLRETAFWGVYFQVVEIVPAVENAYATHYGEAPLGG